MIKIYLLFLSFVGDIYAAPTISLDKAIEPLTSITSALIGQVLVVVATLALVFIGFSFFFGENDEAQKKKLVNWAKGGVIVLSASSIAAMWG